MTSWTRSLGSSCSQADGREPDSWAVLARIIREASMHLKAHGHPAFSLFDFLGIQWVPDGLGAAGRGLGVLAAEFRMVPRLAREDLERLRSLDTEDSLPPGTPRQYHQVIVWSDTG